ncbi:hypothetical protein WME99_17360 [Sorangium sp. So ce136]|uniref:hypothetical protein n=1 Tax=Sorangium sp. So ce136 TaxID=3133284 RepID=UPI003F0C2102
MPHTMQRHEVSGPMICLFEMDEVLGLIVLCATGASYFNQTGSVCCLHDLTTEIVVQVGECS